MLASKFAPQQAASNASNQASSKVLQQASFEEATTIVLKGGHSERVMDKKLYIEACPDAKDHAKYSSKVCSTYEDNDCLCTDFTIAESFRG